MKRQKKKETKENDKGKKTYNLPAITDIITKIN